MKRLIQISLPAACAFWFAASVWAQGTNPVLFVIWGDSRSSGSGVNTSVLSSLSTQANALGPSFTLFTGDLCTRFDNTCQSTGSSGWMFAINGGANPGNGMFNITFVSHGNHDAGLHGWQSYFDSMDVSGSLTGMEAVAATLAGGGATNFVSKTDDATYSFDYAGLHFVTLDDPGDVSKLSRQEISWLDGDLTAAEGRGIAHTFIYFHGPIYFVDGHPATPPAELITVLNRHPSVTATFHGHEHVLAYVHLDSTRIPMLTQPFEEFVSAGAGAPLYTCSTGRSDFCEDTQFGFMTLETNSTGTAFTVNVYEQGNTTPVFSKTF